MKNKKYIKLAVIAACLFSLCIGSTFAYLTYRQTIVNTFTVGHNEITVTEDYEPPKEMQAGDNRYKKNVQVKNTGTVPCFIRVYVAFSDGDIEKTSKLSPNGTDYYPASEYGNHLPDGWAFIPENTDQELGGYYYYTKPVESGQKTTALFQKVNTHFETAEDVKPYEIFVYAESVQTRDKDGAEFSGADQWKSAWTEFLERK